MMFRKITLLTLALCSQTLAGSGHSPNTLQFYAGLSGGVNQLTGRRNENVVNSPPVQNISFANNVSIVRRGIVTSLFGGFRFNISKFPLFIGPEIYLGRSEGQSEFNSFVNDPFSFSNRVMQTSLKLSNFYGATIQTGVNISHSSRLYFLFGIDSRQCRYSVLYVPRSALAFGGIRDLPPTSFSTTKWLNGFIWGLGLEKSWNSFQIGGDIRITDNKPLKASFSTPSGDDATIDTINNLIKSKNYRISLRISYLF